MTVCKGIEKVWVDVILALQPWTNERHAFTNYAALFFKYFFRIFYMKFIFALTFGDVIYGRVVLKSDHFFLQRSFE